MKIRKTQKILFYMMFEFDKLCVDNDINYSLSYGSLLGAVRHSGFIPWDDDLDIWMLPKDLIKLRQLFKKDNEIFILSNKYTEENNFLSFDKIILKGSSSSYKNYKDFGVNTGFFIDIFPLYYQPTKLVNKLIWKFNLNVLKIINNINFLSVDYWQKSKVGKISKFICTFLSHKDINMLFKKLQAHLLEFEPSNFVCDIEAAPFIFIESNHFENIVRTKFESYYFNIPCNSNVLLEQLYGDYMQIPTIDKRENHECFNFEITEHKMRKIEEFYEKQ